MFAIGMLCEGMFQTCFECGRPAEVATLKQQQILRSQAGRHCGYFLAAIEIIEILGVPKPGRLQLLCGSARYRSLAPFCGLAFALFCAHLHVSASDCVYREHPKRDDDN